MTPAESKHVFQWDDVGGIAVVHFLTPILRDERVIRTVFDAMDELIEDGRTRVVLNFAGIEGFASFAIGKLIRLEGKLQPPGGKLVLCSLTPIVTEIVDLMNLRRMFTIYETEREALESFV